MNGVMSKPKQIQVWWHGIAALPPNSQDHTYHALRRVWGDHTMAGGRSFYQVGSEDHVTAALFQNWALFPDPDWVTKFISAAGGSAGKVKRVRWAYACEEVLDGQLQPFHKRNFVIPDILLLFEDEHGLGLIGFEVKKPGKATEVPDDRKLATYIDLPSTRRITRRYGCLLVSDQVAELSRRTCHGNWPVLTWEQLGNLQIEAARTLPVLVAERVANWIGWHFKRHGIHTIGLNATPGPTTAAYGTSSGYSQIDRLPIPESIRRFLKGSECVEAVWRGTQSEPALSWLTQEPTVEQIRRRKWQKTEDRRVCRWHFDWSPTDERIWT